MAGQQQGLNKKGMNLDFGKLSEAAKQQLLQSMLQGQKNIQQSLQKLMKEMRQSSNSMDKEN